MTHKDIYTKFLIEYDKANVTSSYPSLTEYEVATILDRAYLALIAQKLTGNNIRRAPFEADIKATHDLEPLITHADPEFFDNGHSPAMNIAQYKLPEDCMYYLQSQINYTASGKTLDGLQKRLLPVKLVPHNIAEKFFATQYNMPWVKNPVCYIEDGTVYVVYDSINKPLVSTQDTSHLTYIRYPKKFVDSAEYTKPSDPGTQQPDTPTVTTGLFIVSKSKLNSSDILGGRDVTPIEDGGTDAPTQTTYYSLDVSMLDDAYNQYAPSTDEG